MTLHGLGKMIIPGTGFPYAGGPDRAFEADEVIAFGKCSAWGSSVIQYWVRLSGGAELMVRACDQDKQAERWLRRLAKLIPGHRVSCSRSDGWKLVWVDIPR
jgi:hypothetical protein